MFALVGGETLNKTCEIVKSTRFPFHGNFISVLARYVHMPVICQWSPATLLADMFEAQEVRGYSDIASQAGLDLPQMRVGAGRYCPPA